jgi:hypothetical protein
VTHQHPLFNALTHIATGNKLNNTAPRRPLCTTYRRDIGHATVHTVGQTQSDNRVIESAKVQKVLTLLRQLTLATDAGTMF